MADSRRFGLLMKRWLWVGVLLAALIAGTLSRAATERPAASPSLADAEMTMEQAYAKQQILDRLRDPDSAKFKAVTVAVVGGDVIYCGQINAKNAYGGYVGYKWFYSYGKRRATPNPEATGGEANMLSSPYSDDNPYADRCGYGTPSLRPVTGF